MNTTERVIRKTLMALDDKTRSKLEQLRRDIGARRERSDSRIQSIISPEANDRGEKLRDVLNRVRGHLAEVEYAEAEVTADDHFKHGSGLPHHLRRTPHHTV